MDVPFYKCSSEDQRCDFVLHEWCTGLPAELPNYPGHPQHTLVFVSKVPRNLFGIFYCKNCASYCNGFAYGCAECDYYIDVNCGFIPEEITHEAHPDHILSRCDRGSMREPCVAEGSRYSGKVIFMGRLFTCPVDDTLFRLVESLEDWNCFPWGEHIWTHLYDQIQNVIEKHSDEYYFGMKRDQMFGSLSHLKDAIVGGLKIQMLYQEQLVGRKSRSLTDLIVVTFLQRLEQESTTTSDIRPTKAEYESSWWIRSQLFFRQHVPKALVVQHHSMYETYLAKFEKSRKRSHSCFRTSSGVLTTVISRPKKWIKDEVISQLNLRVFKLETIIQ
ncbi:zinc finger, PHD-type containing protein, partial [Tanacetum coccineum]